MPCTNINRKLLKFHNHLFLNVFSIDWLTARRHLITQQRVHHDTKAPIINVWAIRLPRYEHLGRHVARCPNRINCLSILIEHGCRTKIDQLDLLSIFICEHDTLKLDVSVHNAHLLMQVCKSALCLLDDLNDVRLGEFLSLGDDVLERGAL